MTAEDSKEVRLSAKSVDEWAEEQTFASTEDIQIPELMADRVIGQE